MKCTFRLLVLVVVALSYYVESSRYLIVKDDKESPKITEFPHVVKPLGARTLPRCPGEKIVQPCTLKKTPNECDDWVDIPGSPPNPANVCICKPYNLPGISKKPVGRCASRYMHDD